MVGSGRVLEWVEDPGGVDGLGWGAAPTCAGERTAVGGATAAAEVGPGAVRTLPTASSLWVHFPGESLEKVTALRLDGRNMLEGSDYQIPYVPSDLKLLLAVTGRRGRNWVRCPKLASRPRLESAIIAGGRWEWRQR